MGTTVEKLTYLNETKGKLKDVINYTGAGIDGDTTFRNYDKKLYDGLLNSLADSSTLYSNLPKVGSQTGTSVQLNGTGNAPMRLSFAPSETTYRTIPNEYQQVEYIESSGTQYIDSLINADGNLRVVINMQYISSISDNDTNFGAIYYSSDPGIRYHVMIQGNDYYLYSGDQSQTNKSYIKQYKDFNRHLFDIDVPNNRCYTDGVLYNITASNNFDTTLNFWLFGRNSNLNNLQYFNNSRLYSCKMYVSGFLTRDYVPCYRKSDNVAGLYDFVSGNFFTNSGTGTFAVGSSVLPTPNSPQEIRTISGNNTIKVNGKNLAKTTDCNVSGTNYSMVINNGNIEITSSTNVAFDLNGGLMTGAWAQTYSNATDYHLTDADSGNYAVKLFVNELSGTGTANCFFEVFTNQRAINAYFNPSTTAEIKNAFTLAQGEYVKNIAVWMNGSDSISLKCNIQLEKGTTPTNYVIYKQPQEAPLNLGTDEYCEIGTYSDEFYLATSSDTSLEEGKWYLKKNIGKIASYNGETITTDYISTTGGLDTGATIYYGLSTPTYTLLNDTLQTEVETIYNNLLSYEGQTNITQQNADLPFVITANGIKAYENI